MAQAIEMLQCLVIVLAMLPITAPVEMICPTRAANCLAEILNANSMMRSIVLKISWIRLGTILNVPLAAFHVNPNQSSTCVGSWTDLSSFGTNPARIRWSCLTVLALEWQVCKFLSADQPSSKNIAMLIPLYRHCFPKVLPLLWKYAERSPLTTLLDRDR